MQMRGVQPRATDPGLERRRLWAERYRQDPAQYVLDCFEFRGDHPSAYQMDVLRGLVGNRRQAMRGPRGCGKSALAAWVVHWFADIWDGFDDWMCVTTASVWNQLTRFLWPEVHKWARRKRWSEIPVTQWDPNRQLQKRSLELTTGQAFALSPGNFQAGEGAHAAHLLYIFDEAKLIEHELFESVEGAMGTGDCLQLALSTPGESSGPFYDICRGAPAYRGWSVRLVTIEEAIAEGRVSQDWADARLEAWGPDHPMYQQYVLAQFASVAGDNLIPLAYAELAQAREGVNGEGRLTALGVDLGEGVGRDATVIARVYDGTSVELEKSMYDDLAKAEDRIIQIVQHDRRLPIIVDAIGVGAGVVKHLDRLGYNVIPFAGGWSTTLTDEADVFGYANWRSAGWYLLAAMLDPKNPWKVEIALPDDEDLRADLTAIKATSMTARQQYRVEPKERAKKALGRSPDSGDAVMMALTGPVLWAAKQQESEQTRWVYAPAGTIGG